MSEEFNKKMIKEISDRWIHIEDKLRGLASEMDNMSFFNDSVELLELEIDQEPVIRWVDFGCCNVRKGFDPLKTYVHCPKCDKKCKTQNFGGGSTLLDVVHAANRWLDRRNKALTDLETENEKENENE